MFTLVIYCYVVSDDYFNGIAMVVVIVIVQNHHCLARTSTGATKKQKNDDGAKIGGGYNVRGQLIQTVGRIVGRYQILWYRWEDTAPRYRGIPVGYWGKPCALRGYCGIQQLVQVPVIIFIINDVIVLVMLILMHLLLIVLFFATTAATKRACPGLYHCGNCLGFANFY